MQTFLPFPDFTASARVLDRQRLGKQRVECAQILAVLTKGHGGWVNHPAVRMWRGYEPALRVYTWRVIEEWCRRGYRNNMGCPEPTPYISPPWLGGAIHASHRAALLAKAPGWYAQFGWSEEPKIDYVWPVP